MINPTLLQVFVSALGHMANKEANYSKPQIQMMSNYLQNNTVKLRRLCHIFFCK